MIPKTIAAVLLAVGSSATIANPQFEAAMDSAAMCSKGVALTAVALQKGRVDDEVTAIAVSSGVAVCVSDELVLALHSGFKGTDDELSLEEARAKANSIVETWVTHNIEMLVKRYPR